MSTWKSQQKYTATGALSFGPVDLNRVNEAFVRYRVEGDPLAQREVDVWTHAFVVRFFMVHCARNRRLGESACDELIGQALERILGGRGSVRRPDRYVGWVWTLCRNLLVDALRRPRVVLESITSDRYAGAPSSSDCHGAETCAAARVALLSCIGRLPGYLQPVAQLRYVEDRSYDEMQQITGKRVATLRVYVQRITRRLKSELSRLGEP